MKITLVMPMGGGGTRFGNYGFDMPKPLIDLQNKPFFYWAVRSIEKYISVEDIIFVVLKAHVERFHIDHVILDYFPKSRIQIIPHILNGAVLTCMEGIKLVEDDKPILFNDCDHAFICNEFYDFARDEEFDVIDGAMLTFVSKDPKYSFVKMDKQGSVVKTAEKEVISNEAICGAYYFKNRQIFKESVTTYLNHCNYQEYFISGVYNDMIAADKIVKTFKTDEHISFGTPEEYEQALCDKRLGLLIGE